MTAGAPIWVVLLVAVGVPVATALIARRVRPVAVEGERENKLIDQLQEELGELRKERAHLIHANAIASARERVLMQYAYKLHEHITKGSPPPPPDFPAELFELQERP